MYNLISTIAERCHAAATKRGKDTSWLGCIQALHTEQREYWEARDNGRDLPDLRVLADEANKLSDEDFTAFYGEKIHNCVTDELADVEKVYNRFRVVAGREVVSMVQNAISYFRFSPQQAEFRKKYNFQSGGVCYQ